jgi:hypothetical protein
VATYNGLKDTATVQVGGITTSSFALTSDNATLNAPGDTVRLYAEAFDPNGIKILNPAVTWKSLSTGVATVTGTNSVGRVTAVAAGTARIVATRGSFTDTATIVVSTNGTGGGTGGGSTTVYVFISPDAGTIQAVGGTLQLSASVRDGLGNLTSNQAVTWSSLDGSLASVSSTGLVTGLMAGTARIRATQNTVSDTAWITVAPPPPTTPQNGLTVDLNVVRWDGGSGSILVNSGIPLPPGYLLASQLRNLVVYVGGVEQSLYVEALKGRHPDGSIRSVLVQWRMSVPTMGSTAKLVLGPNVNRTTTDIAKTTVSYNYSQPLSTAAAALPISPDYLASTQVVGEISPTTFNSTWHSNFTVYGDPKYSAMMREYYTMSVEMAVNYNYYDAVLSNFAWWIRTGNPEYWKRANQFLMPYRDKYVIPNNYGMQPHIVQIEGFEAHYLLTGDATSYTAVQQFGTIFMDPWLPVLGDVTISWHDNRIQARILDIALTALRLGVTTRDFAADARLALNRILSSQSADGAYRLGAHCWQDTPFMNGILNTVFIKYYTYFEADPRIPASIKKNIDFMWSKEWLPGDLSFVYLEGDCPGQGGPGPAPDLNLMISNSYAWYGRYSGDGSYRFKGDQIFNSGVVNTWLDGMKQFNENYHASFHYDVFRR